MATFNLTAPNSTLGGTWAIATATDCSCPDPNTCNATLDPTGLLTITTPVLTTCVVYGIYTVGIGDCESASVHQITIIPKSCITFIESVTADWQLHLNRLTVNGAAVNTSFVYAVVPTTAVCGDYTGAIAWGYKGNCGYPIPDDTTPKANFATSNAEQIFQVPAGDYKVVIACVDDTVLEDCDKIECCEYEITVADLDLCAVYSPCAPLTINYPLNPSNFTINIPMVVDQDKCVRMDFSGGGAVVDTVELQVLTTTGWEYVELDPLNINVDPLVSNYQINTAGSSSIVVRTADTALIPGTPHLPANSILFGTQYKLNWIISRADSNGTSWNCTLSCCDCLPACPPVQYPCLTNVVEIPIPNCASACSNLQIEGHYSRTKNEVLSFISGGCPPGVTCLGNIGSSTTTIPMAGIHTNDDPEFYIVPNNALLAKNTVSGGSPCGVTGKIELTSDITYTLTPTQYILNYGIANISIYNDIRDMILGVVDKSNYVLTFLILSDANNCSDAIGNLLQVPPVYFVENGNLTTFNMNDTDGIITITPPVSTVNTCVSLLEPGSPKQELFACKDTVIPKTITGNIILTSSTIAYVSEVARATAFSTFIGTPAYAVPCPAFYERGNFIIMDPDNPTTTWLYTSAATNGPTCPPLSSSPSTVIYQYAAGLDPNLSYGNFDPINSGGCVGWRDTTLLRNYTVAPGTGVGFNNCYTG